MKKLLKINPQYLISIGLILMGIGGVFLMKQVIRVLEFFY